MLALSFFTVVFSSLMWFIYAVVNVSDKLGRDGLASAGIMDISIHIAFILLPIFTVWVIFGIISQYLHNQNFNRNLFYLLGQMKKNQDYSDLLARIMLEGEQQIKDGFAVQQFDLFISDMNELISDIIQRSSLASAEQIERLWSKVRNGGKWAFGKVIIEVYQNQPSFQMRILEKAANDKVLAGTIMEFCARYLGTVELFEKHDHEKIFLSMIENGVLGKVYSIFSPLSGELRRKRNENLQQNTFEDSLAEEPNYVAKVQTVQQKIQKTAATHAENISAYSPQPSSGGKFNLGEKLSFFKRKKEEAVLEKEEPDMLSLALERSFGNDTASRQEPSFELVADIPETTTNYNLVSEPETVPAPEIVLAAKEEPKASAKRVPFAEMSSTQKTLNNLRKEWEEMKKAEGSPYLSENSKSHASKDEDNIEYPFGGWINEDNYHK